MQDNARLHTARFKKNFLKAEIVQRMELPTRCPDLNLIDSDDKMLQDQGLLSLSKT